MRDDDLTAAVRDALDPTPASEAEWPVSRRDTLRALAGVGALAVGPSGAQGAAGTGIADEAYFSNYGWESTADGGVLTIDGAEFTFDGSETIALPDGREASTVVLPDGREASTVVGPDGSVLKEASIPDSVVDQFSAGNFTDPWQNSVGGRDSMTVNGLSSTTVDGNPTVSGEGGSDHGLADVFDVDAEGGGFGLAVTVRPRSTNTRFMGRFDSAFDNGFSFRAIPELNIRLDSGGDQIQTQSTTELDDTKMYACIVNVLGPDATDIELYIDDVTDGSMEQSVVYNDAGYNTDNFVNPGVDPMFFAENHDGSVAVSEPMDIGVIEINSDPYTENERLGFLNRRPEV